ncbi:hypothetical protein GOODEAATRI_020868 [Goodea atripinnis]|uniref:Uncharacterized protein n=1 Tax=Goodea atripinnis TaxID=208336 RepID=A0ABV0PFR1_9TELE
MNKDGKVNKSMEKNNSIPYTLLSKCCLFFYPSFLSFFHPMFLMPFLPSFLPCSFLPLPCLSLLPFLVSFLYFSVCLSVPFFFLPSSQLSFFKFIIIILKHE